MQNVYQEVTDRIIEKMEQGIIPWHKPWTGVEEGAVSYATGKPYSLLNQLLLEEDGEYLTWNQIKKLGGSVKKGAKSKIVVFYTMAVKKEKNAAGEEVEDTYPVLTSYHVFHIKDCIGIEPKLKTEKKEHEPIKEAENVIEGYVNRSGLHFTNNQPSAKAYYSKTEDLVVVPMISQYEVKEEYYSTAFHELTHSTMLKTRCDREDAAKFSFKNDENYSREELVAEIGSAMLCTSVGIETEKVFKNSVAYIQAWMKALKNDNKMIVWAASRAEKAAKFILNVE